MDALRHGNPSGARRRAGARLTAPMPPTSAWRRYLRFWGPDVDADVDDELQFHIEQLIADYRARGLSVDDARRAAAERFGSVREIGDMLRSHDRARGDRRQRIDALRHFAGQLRTATRSLARASGFTITAVLTLMLGIGFSTGVFAVAHTLLLTPLPVRDEQALVVLWARTADGSVPNFPLGAEEARAFARSARSLERIASFTYQSPFPQPVVQGDRIVRMRQAQVSGNFFSVLGANAYLGRTIGEPDDRSGAGPVAVISYDAWHRYFAADPRVLGRRLQIYSSGIAYTVVGVAARGLAFPAETEYWVPLSTSIPAGDEQFVALNLIGRLATGGTPERARSELSSFYARPDAPPARPKLDAIVKPLRTVVLGDTRAAVIAFAIAVALLLVITCINVAALLLVRGLTRIQEMAVRSALGARRRHLLSLLLVEGSVLALIGGVLGVAFAAVGLRAFVAFAPPDLPRLSEVGLSATAIVASITVTVASLLAFAIVPAWSQSDVDTQTVLRSGTRQSMGRRSRVVTEALVVGQIALALIIVSGAALITRSLINLQRAELAFEPSHLLVADLAFRAGEYTGGARQTLLLDQLLAVIEAIPGVVAASPVVAAPFSGIGGWDARLSADGQTARDAAVNPMLNVEVVAPAYFRTLSLRLLEGRPLNDTDRERALRVVVVSESVARYYWPSKEALGKRLLVPSDTLAFTVVGVVQDTRYRDLRAPRASIYFPLHQSFFPFAPTTLVVRSTGPPEALISTIRQAVASGAPGVEIARIEPFEQFMRGPLALPRMNTALLVVFASAALLLAAVGLFGAMASLVRHRTRELGIRMALGATPSQVKKMVLKRGLGVAGLGVTVGCLGALLANRALRSLLYAVSPTDAVTLVLVTALLLLVAVIATIVPARAAMRIDPGIALRADV